MGVRQQDGTHRLPPLSHPHPLQPAQNCLRVAIISAVHQNHLAITGWNDANRNNSVLYLNGPA